MTLQQMVRFFEAHAVVDNLVVQKNHRSVPCALSQHEVREPVGRILCGPNFDILKAIAKLLISKSLASRNVSEIPGYFREVKMLKL